MSSFFFVFSMNMTGFVLNIYRTYFPQNITRIVLKKWIGLKSDWICPKIGWLWRQYDWIYLSSEWICPKFDWIWPKYDCKFSWYDWVCPKAKYVWNVHLNDRICPKCNWISSKYYCICTSHIFVNKTQASRVCLYMKKWQRFS